MSLGRKLGVDEDYLECIDENSCSGVVEKAMKMLKRWRNLGSATYEKLGEALTKVGKGRLAEKYC